MLNNAAINYILQFIMIEQEQEDHIIEVFNIEAQGACTAQQLHVIRSQIYAQVQAKDFPKCCMCERHLIMVLFRWYQANSYCTLCYLSKLRRGKHAYVIIDPDLNDPILTNFILNADQQQVQFTRSQQIQQAVQRLNAYERRETAKTVQRTFEEVGSDGPLPLEEERLEYQPQIRNQKWFKVYSTLNDGLQRADKNIFDFILGHVQDHWDQELKICALVGYQRQFNERQKRDKMAQIIAKMHPERRIKPEDFFAAFSKTYDPIMDSIRRDSERFQEFKLSCIKLIKQSDNFIIWHSSKERAMKDESEELGKKR